MYVSSRLLEANKKAGVIQLLLLWIQGLEKKKKIKSRRYLLLIGTFVPVLLVVRPFLKDKKKKKPTTSRRLCSLFVTCMWLKKAQPVEYTHVFLVSRGPAALFGAHSCASTANMARIPPTNPSDINGTMKPSDYFHLLTLRELFYVFKLGP